MRKETDKKTYQFAFISGISLFYDLYFYFFIRFIF